MDVAGGFGLALRHWTPLIERWIFRCSSDQSVDVPKVNRFEKDAAAWQNEVINSHSYKYVHEFGRKRKADRRLNANGPRFALALFH